MNIKNKECLVKVSPTELPSSNKEEKTETTREEPPHGDHSPWGGGHLATIQRHLALKFTGSVSSEGGPQGPLADAAAWELDRGEKADKKERQRQRKREKEREAKAAGRLELEDSSQETSCPQATATTAAGAVMSEAAGRSAPDPGTSRNGGRDHRHGVDRPMGRGGSLVASRGPRAWGARTEAKKRTIVLPSAPAQRVGVSVEGPKGSAARLASTRLHRRKDLGPTRILPQSGVTRSLGVRQPADHGEGRPCVSDAKRHEGIILAADRGSTFGIWFRG